MSKKFQNAFSRQEQNSMKRKKGLHEVRSIVGVYATAIGIATT